MEKQAEYITDALEMIGMTEPKQIIQEVSGFVPVFEALLEKYDDHITALVFGRRWQYCRMRDGVCKASLETIANDLKISPATVMRHTERLVEDGYLIDLTPDLRNVPHSYADAGKIVMKSQLTASISQGNTSISQGNATVSESQLIKGINRQDKKGDVLDGILDYQLKPKAIRDAFAKHFRLTPNWDAKYNRQFLEWAVEVKMTPEQVECAAKLWGSDRRFNWSVPTLKGIQEHWLELTEKKTDEARPQYASMIRTIGQ